MTTTRKLAPFSVRLAALRQRAGLNRNQLAVAAGLARIHVSRLERGTHEPTLATLRKLAAALEVPLSELI